MMQSKNFIPTLFVLVLVMCFFGVTNTVAREKLDLETTIEAKINFQDNRDLDDSKDDFLSFLDPTLTVEALYEASSYFEIFTELEATKRINLDHGDDISSPANDDELNLKQLYFDVKDLPAGGLTLRVGRQEFEDTREWLYDEELDAVRVFYEHLNWSAELSASRQLVFRENLLSNDSYDEHRNYYMAYGTYKPFKDHEFNAYTILVDDRDASDAQLHFGLRSRGHFLDTLAYWVDLGAVHGEDGDADIRGYGFDAGLTYTFDTKLSPALTVGYAFGSGDSDREDSVDRNFRQTGIQDNTGRFSGVEDVQLYGETLDPELSNIGLLTLGLGIRPTEKSSVEVIYHHYRQDEPVAAELRNAWIRAETEGKNRELGQAIDIVIGFQEVHNLQLYAKYGLFFPGDAFPESAEQAYTFQIGFEYEF